MNERTSLSDLVVAVIITPVASIAAIVIFRRVSKWFERALTRTFAETVRDTMAPDLSRLGTRLGSSIDELREAWVKQSNHTNNRLDALEDGMGSLTERVATLEGKVQRRRGSDQ